MGKKLTSWEKRQRESEKEKERLNKAAQVKQRREKEKNEKQNALDSQKQFAKQNFDLFNFLVEMLKNLSRKGYNKVILFEASVLPAKITIPKFSKSYNIKKLKSRISKTDFFENPYIEKLTKDSKISYDDFKKIHASGLGKLFGFGVKSKHESFKKDKKKELTRLVAKEENRKQNFLDELEKHNELLNKENKALIIQTEKLKNDSKSLYDKVKKQLEHYNKEVKKIKNSLKKLAERTTDEFKYTFLQGLPIQFVDLDNTAKELISTTKELDAKFYNSPSKTIKCGAKFNTNKIEIFLLIPQDYFPIEEKQINLLKETYSITKMTKSLKSEIEDSFFASLMMNYALYGFKSANFVDTVTTSFVYEGHDELTGIKTFKIRNAIEFDKNTFEKIQLDKIVPSKSIKQFKKLENIIVDDIIWKDKSSNLKNSKSEFFKELSKVSKLEKEIKTNDLAVFNSSSDVQPKETDELKESYARVLKISGKRFKSKSTGAKKSDGNFYLQKKGLRNPEKEVNASSLLAQQMKNISEENKELEDLIKNYSKKS